MGGSSLGPASEAGVLFLRPREAKLSRNSWPTSADTGVACSTTSGFVPAGRGPTEKKFVRKPVNEFHQVCRIRSWEFTGVLGVRRAHRVFPLQIRVRIAIVLEAPVGGVGSLLLLADPAEVLQHRKSESILKRQIRMRYRKNKYYGARYSGDPEALLGAEESCCGYKELAHIFRWASKSFGRSAWP